ncbi:MAG TPA: condensation domain-containing protein, partial [Longimicrobium sp.]|nr:condensation domain-containing protein [Longimicrobium sp.]
MSDVQDRIAGLSKAKRALLDRLRVAAVRAPDGVPRRGGGPAPLSWEQRRLWFLHRLAPEGGAYTIPAALRLAGALDGGALQAAVRRVAERHEAMRLTFREVDGEPVQEAGPADRVRIDREDLRMRPGDVDAALAEFFARGFDLHREPPFRALLLRTADDEHVLALASHHIASDGGSTAVLLREIPAFYAAEVAGRDAHLPDPPLQFPDFAAWQRGQTVDAAALEWWRDALAGAPQVLEVPADRPRPAAQSFEGSRLAFALGGELSEGVRALAAGEQASVFSVLLAALAVLLHRATGEDDLLIGSAVTNRNAPGADAAVGFFVNTVPLRMRVDADASPRTLISQARRRVAEAQDHAGVPFDRIVDAAEVRRDPGRPPLVQVIVSLDPAEEDVLAIPGITATRLPVDTGAAPFDLMVSVADGRDGIRGELQYPTALYDAETIQRLADRLTATLVAFVDAPAAPVIDLPLVAEDERRTLAAWARGADARADGCVHRLIEAQARATPDALAVAWADQEVSYAALERRANRIAHHLIGLGMGPETRVGVLLERTPALVATLLGVMKAGAAYVPLDPRNPP